MITPAQYKEIRKSIGLTQGELAQVLGLTERHIRNLESGDSPIKRVHWLALREVQRLASE